MAKKKTTKTASELISSFFSNLGNLEGMDNDIANVIQNLWKEGKLGRDELLSEFEQVRTREGHDGAKKT